MTYGGGTGSSKKFRIKSSFLETVGEMVGGAADLPDSCNEFLIASARKTSSSWIFLGASSSTIFFPMDDDVEEAGSGGAKGLELDEWDGYVEYDGAEAEGFIIFDEGPTE